MSNKRASKNPIHIALGYAAAADGFGVGYARLCAPSSNPESPIRFTFALRPQPGLRGRDVAYAALRAAATQVRALGVTRAHFHLDDEFLPLDLSERRALPQALVLPYVALRCELNRFRDSAVSYEEEADRDLAARARAEATLHVAA